MVDALEYLHEINVVHRDLKPENILLTKGDNIKIIDFGLSSQYDTNKYLNTACGSPSYAAPEMIAGKAYNPLKVDIWSLGITLYAMVCGFLPFEDPDQQILYKRIMLGSFMIPKYISEPLKDLLNKILNTNPENRYNLQNIRDHEWFNQIS